MSDDIRTSSETANAECDLETSGLVFTRDEIIAMGLASPDDKDCPSESELNSGEVGSRSNKRKCLEIGSTKNNSGDLFDSLIKSEKPGDPNFGILVRKKPKKTKSNPKPATKALDCDVVDLTTNWDLDPDENPTGSVMPESVSEKYERMRLNGSPWIPTREEIFERFRHIFVRRPDGSYPMGIYDIKNITVSPKGIGASADPVVARYYFLELFHRSRHFKVRPRKRSDTYDSLSQAWTEFVQRINTMGIDDFELSIRNNRFHYIKRSLITLRQEIHNECLRLPIECCAGRYCTLCLNPTGGKDDPEITRELFTLPESFQKRVHYVWKLECQLSKYEISVQDRERLVLKSHTVPKSQTRVKTRANARGIQRKEPCPFPLPSYSADERGYPVDAVKLAQKYVPDETYVNTDEKEFSQQSSTLRSGNSATKEEGEVLDFPVGEDFFSRPLPSAQPDFQIALDRFENEMNRRLNEEQMARMNILARVLRLEEKVNRVEFLERKFEEFEKEKEVFSLLETEHAKLVKDHKLLLGRVRRLEQEDERRKGNNECIP